MFNQEDIDALSNMTGLSEVEVIADETIGAEYILRQRMYHASGQQGALPPLALIDMLRFLGYEPPQRKAPQKSMEINWSEHRAGTRVVVTPDPEKPERQFYGRYQYVSDIGCAAVVLDGAVNGYVEEFAFRQLSLAPEGSPSFVSQTDKKLTSFQQPQAADCANLHNSPSEEEDSQEPAEEVREQVAPRNRVPLMSQDWSHVDPGSPVHYQSGSETLEAQFIEEGPEDGQLSLFVDGRLVIVPEEHVVA